jgi:YHS domain-containing protein
MAKDPVCGMEVDESTAKHTTHYEGQTYFFCAPGCKKAFEADPRKILESGPHAIDGRSWPLTHACDERCHASALGHDVPRSACSQRARRRRTPGSARSGRRGSCFGRRTGRARRRSVRRTHSGPAAEARGFVSCPYAHAAGGGTVATRTRGPMSSMNDMGAA